MNRVAELVATVGYVGKLPGAPGTYAAVITSVVLYGLGGAGTLPWAPHAAGVGIVTILGVLAAARVARATGAEDPQQVVIDEVAGQLLTFALVPLTPLNLILGTALFRLFDIWKPFPVRRLEHIPHGVGVMADDLAAAVYACALLHLATWLLGR